MKRIIAITFVVLMVFSIFPIVSAAADGSITTDGTYDISAYGNNSTITIDTGLTVTLTNTGGAQYQNMHIVCGAGTALSINNVNINNSLTVGSCPLSFTGMGNTLNLIGTSTLKAGENAPGIRVSGIAILEIMGSGRVNVTGGESGAGIGSGKNEAGGNIKISGGTINATSGNYAAAIGTGKNDVRCAGGNITITGGNINATGDFGGSGIGGGWWSGAGNITISGGTVYATTTSASGAAIGSGYVAGEPGSIHITGGTVKAIAADGINCAGLGAGNWSDGLNITIEGGTVTAVGGERGAGIGGAYQRDAGNITITGGTIYASKGADSNQDIGNGKEGTGGSLNISGNAAIFLKNDTYLEPTTTSHQHFVINDTANVYGYTIPSDYPYPFGAFFALYTLTYDVNFGTGTVADPITKIVDSTTIVEDGSGISRYSYTNGGWSIASDGSGTIYQPGDTFNFTGNTTLYVKWDEIPVESVTLSKTSIELVHHDTSSLTADVLPINATHPEVSWNSSNNGVATVDSSVNIVAAGVGSAVITAEADGVSAECTVTVNKKPVESVIPSQMSLALIHHDEVSLTAEVLPANASYPVLTWKSSNNSVATVDSSGNIVAAGVGSTVITVEADGVSEVCTIAVSKKPVDSVILSEETLTMLHHNTAVLMTEILPVNATYSEVTWESSNTDVVTVDQSGKIEAVGLGSAVITATADGASDTCEVTINKKPVTSVTLSEENLTMVHHDTGTLTADVLPVNATYPQVTWVTSDASVVTVDHEGNIEAVGLGNAVITASADGVSDTCNVTVNKKPVEGITLSKEALTIVHHNKATLTAEVLPVNATYQEVTWASSDTSVVTIDENGKISAVGVGSAEITSTADGVTAVCEITVNKKPVEIVTLNSTDETVIVGDVIKLSSDVLPTNATYTDVTWVSSDDTLATVDENGVVTAIKGGNVRITASADGISADCNIFIIQPVTSVSQSYESKIMVHHDTLTLTSEVLPDDATYPEVTWTTSNKNVATVNQDGKVMAVGVGSATITSTADGISDTCVITVNKNPVTGVALNKTELSLVHHDTATLTTSITPSNATYQEVTWASSDTSIITIDENGNISAVGVGSAEITSTADGVTAVCEITVNKKPVEIVTLNSTDETVIVGDVIKLSSDVLPTNATYTDVTWVSSDDTLATVDENGVVTAIKGGNVRITASADGISADCNIFIIQPVTSVSQSYASKTMVHHDTLTLTSEVLPDDATYPEVTWTTSNKNAATVNEDGKVMAVGVGSATITSTADGISDTCVITVNKNPVTGVALNKTELSLVHHDTATLTAAISPSNATYQEVTWASSDTSVITIDENGTISAVGVGSAEISATADGATAVCNVTVEKIPVKSVTLNEKAILLNTDGSFELTASVEPSNATYSQVSWKSSDPSVVEVDNTGVVKAINIGSAVVTVEADEIEATCEVTVEPILKKTVTITGVLIDDKGKPLAGKAVELHSDPMFTVTDSEGRFTFENVCVEHHTLIIKDNAGDPIKEFEIDLNTKDDFEWKEDEKTCVNIMLSNDTAAVEISISLNNDDFGITDVQDVTYPSEEPGLKWEYILVGAALLLVVLVGIFVTLMVKRRKAS